LETVLVPQCSTNFQQRHAVQIKYWFSLWMVTRLDAIAGEAQHICHAHGRTTQNIALNGDAVLVTAGNLHDRGVTDAGQQGADRQAGHMAIGAATIGGIDRVDIAVEYTGTPVDVFRIGRIGRVQL
jgi:hypothetical protein